MSDYCDETLKQIYEYLDGEMTWWRARQIRHHIDECPPCCDTFSFEDHFLRTVRTSLHEEPPPEMMDRLRSVLRAETDG